MEKLLLNKRLANTILVLLVPWLVLIGLQLFMSVYLGNWALVTLVLTWVVGWYLIWRRPRRGK